MIRTGPPSSTSMPSAARITRFWNAGSFGGPTGRPARTVPTARAAASCSRPAAGSTRRRRSRCPPPRDNGPARSRRACKPVKRGRAGRYRLCPALGGFGAGDELFERKTTMPAVHRFCERVRCGAHAYQRSFLDAQLGRDLVGSANPSAADVAGQSVGVLDSRIAPATGNTRRSRNWPVCAGPRVRNPAPSSGQSSANSFPGGWLGSTWPRLWTVDIAGTREN